MLRRPLVPTDLSLDGKATIAKARELADPQNMSALMRLHPDGIGIVDLADRHDLSWGDAKAVVQEAERAGRLKVRRTLDGHIRFVWLPGTAPPLSSIEAAVLRSARKELEEGPEEIWLSGAAQLLGVTEKTVERALDFLVFAELLTRKGRTYALTDLGKGKGVPA